MTREEEFQNALNAYNNLDVHINKTLRLIGIAAIKKQIPMKPIYEADGYADGKLVYDYAECPNCGHFFEYCINDWWCNYCSDCGQKLDWSVEEDWSEEE